MSVSEIYANGHVRFMDVDLLVTPGALVPREETELLGNTALQTIHQMGLAAPRVIDMCCGSGNLGSAMAARLPNATLWLSDLTDGCVNAARRNVAHLSLGARANVYQGDLFASLAGLGLEGGIDVVVCNPPYISTKRLEGDRASLLEHEPREAFDGGPYGLSIHQRVVKEALPFLRVGGYLLFEIGLGQDKQIKMVFDRVKAYEDFSLIQNSNGEARVALARKRAS
jgi:release factor glutamine methyltransferase